ncbi:MAG: tripartite tricarboxylate transporter substrate binding protein, partial [Gammaproteobacteria bacterium]|nr:tripartite tricarboxylate transporter substrate binding protein [Gammaproteobacteria bacterium]
AKAGKLRALAVGGSQRNAALPDVPTVADTLPGYLATSWTAFVAPPGTPPDIASKLQTAIAEVKKMPEVQNRMLEAGDQTFDTTPAQMAEFLKQETQRWDALIKSARITVQ